MFTSRNKALLLLTVVALFSCNNQSEVVTEEAPAETELDNTQAEVLEQPLDTNLLVNTIDNKRLEIEAQLEQIEKVEIDTDSLRPKIAQKWDKVHYYLQDGKVVRIKTYPYEGISTRTEEFYFNDGELILVTIEDDGLGNPGKEKGMIDKMYYFHQGLFLTEYNSSKEREYGIKESESEELMQEAQEYLDIFTDR